MKSNYDFAAAGRRGAAARKTIGGGWPKGKRRNDPGYSERTYQRVLGEVSAAVREPVRRERSIRMAAQHCGVSDRTVRRWLDGTDRPLSSMVRKLDGWLRQIAPGRR